MHCTKILHNRKKPTPFFYQHLFQITPIKYIKSNNNFKLQQKKKAGCKVYESTVVVLSKRVDNNHDDDYYSIPINE